MTALMEDAKWPRAAHWLKAYSEEPRIDLAVFGVPAHETSISKTGADATPSAIRGALLRYSTYSYSHDIDLAVVQARDLGDAVNPDSAEGESRTMKLASNAAALSELSVALGGDNSITYAVMAGAHSLSESGLITLDAHHDLRDGISNGSPVRRLIEAGLPGRNVVQIGINDFSNSPEYAKLAKSLGIKVITRNQLRGLTPQQAWQLALEHLSTVQSIHVDIDVDVCDRSFVPACPASAPGGISADELRQYAFLAGHTKSVKSIDITEIDATADAADLRTVRLGALLILEAATGLAKR